MASIGDLISGPFAQLIYTLIGGQEQQRAYNQARKDNLQRYNQGLGILDELEGNLGGTIYGQNKREEGIARSARDGAQDRAQYLSGQINTGYQNRENDILNYLKSQLPGLETAYGNRQGSVLSGFDQGRAGVNTQGNQLSTDLQGGYKDLEKRAGDISSTLGAQSRIDIDRGFKAKQAAATADLTARGLTGSTIAPSVATGVERERSAEQRRLQDDLTRQQLDIMTNIGGAGLSAQERVGSQNLSREERMAQLRADLESALSADTIQQKAKNIEATGNAKAGLSADRLGAMNDIGRWQTGLNYDTNQNYLNSIIRGNDRAYGNQMDIPMKRLEWIYNRNDQYPSTNAWSQLANQFGQNAPEPPKPKTNWFAPLAGAAGSVGAAKIYTFTCIDSESMIDTPLGPKPLCAIYVGDQVIGSDGKPHTVTDRDCGQPHPDRRNDYISISCDEGSLVCTKDHVIDGKPAGQWTVGDVMHRKEGSTIVRHVSWTPFRKSGDLKLEGNVPYYANGFIVHSMFDVVYSTVLVEDIDTGTKEIKRHPIPRKKKLVPAE